MNKFNKLILDLENIDVKIQCCRCVPYLRNMIILKRPCYMKERLTIEEVQVALNLKELNEKFDIKASNVGKALQQKGGRLLGTTKEELGEG